jgi:predicted Fe-Mo cluster-binding NifX family protein
MIRRAAFASSDGFFINFHFGRANAFFVYDTGGPDARVFVEKRRNYLIPSQGGIGQGAAHDSENLERVAAMLYDCDAIFVSRIGQKPADFLTGRGFRVFQLEAVISDVLDAIAEENETELEKTLSGGT